MIDGAVLTSELAKQVSRLEDDLRGRADSVADVAAIVETEWQRAHDAGRTAHDLRPVIEPGVGRVGTWWAAAAGWWTERRLSSSMRSVADLMHQRVVGVRTRERSGRVGGWQGVSRTVRGRAGRRRPVPRRGARHPRGSCRSAT